MKSIRRAIGALVVFAVLGTPALHAQTPVELDGIVVTATATPQELSTLGNHVTLISGDEIVARGISSVSDVLREVPGLAVVRSGSFGGVTSVFFRGGESDYTLVLVDGVQVNQPGGAFDWSGLTTENIERIEIVRGPSSALHGSDAIGGVIHIITRSGAGTAGLRGSANFRMGSFGRYDNSVEVNGAGDRATYGISLSRSRTDGILDFNNRAENTVLSGKASVAIDTRTMATVSARIGDRTFGFPTDFSGNIVDTNQFSFHDENSVSISLERGISDGARIRALVTRYAIDSGTDDSPDGPADTLGSYGFQSLDAYTRNAADIRASFDVGENSALTAGVEFEDQTVRSFNESLSAFGNSNGRSANSRTNRAGYAHLSGDFGGANANVGFRAEDNQRYGTFTTWQIGLSVPIGETTRLRGVGGRAIKEPTFFETFAQGFARGNPDLEPEQSTSIEIGIEQHLLEGDLRLQATWFDQSFEDLIQYTFLPETPGGPNYYNVAQADAAGLEFSADAQLGSVRLFADWTFLDTEVIDSGFDSGEGATFVQGESLLRRPDNSGRLGATVAVLDRVRIDGALRFVGERDDRDFSSFPAAPVKLESYTVFDGGISAHLLDAAGSVPGLELTLRVENLGDTSYEEVLGFPDPGTGHLPRRPLQLGRELPASVRVGLRAALLWAVVPGCLPDLTKKHHPWMQGWC